jgi:NADPH:quinone reductase-like Zn-dependent oxidoreductase
MPSNAAAWLTAEKANPLEVKPAPYTTPGEGELVIKNGAVALKPVDWAIQAKGNALFTWLQYPAILGGDVAGEGTLVYPPNSVIETPTWSMGILTERLRVVVEVGRGVTRFKVGDRVVGLATSLQALDGQNSQGAFQLYTVLNAYTTSIIPDTVSYESASVLPLCLSTAASGMFSKGFLNLQYPTVPPKQTGQTLLVWEGSTSVGCNAVQLAVAAGYEVFSTASPKNFELVKRLGASRVFDYNSPTVVSDLIGAFKGKICAGAIGIGQALSTKTTSLNEACIEVVAKSEGAKFVALAQPPPENILPGVEAKFIWGTSLKDDEVGKAIYEDFLPKALAQGQFVASPEPLVVGKGLDFVQEALKVQMAGVSAKKVVVSL